MKEYSQRIEAIKESTGLNLKELADKLGTSRNRLAYVESGRNGISTKLARLFSEKIPNLSYQWVLKGIGPMYLDLPGPDDTTEGALYHEKPEVPPPPEMFTARDDAMSPEVRKGDLLFLQEVNPDSVILFGNLYFLQTINWLTFVRYIYDEPPDNYLLKSSNREKYPDITIRKKDIYKLKQVTKIVREL